MARQLTLIDSPTAWRLDEKTRAIGRKGVAEARAALAAARRPVPPPPSRPQPPAHRSAA